MLVRFLCTLMRNACSFLIEQIVLAAWKLRVLLETLISTGELHITTDELLANVGPNSGSVQQRSILR